MRTKPSSTAHQPGYHPKTQLSKPLPGAGASRSERDGAPRLICANNRGTASSDDTPPISNSVAGEDEGLLHDARNLIGAVGLYCDLLSMPHVLRAEHRHYADELRLLGERGAAMIEQLIERRASASAALAVSAPDDKTGRASSALYCHRPAAAEALRPAVERCSGVLGRIAEKHCLEIAYGDAAALPVRVSAESIERVLINLVRNAAAALNGTHGSIRISVGLPENSGDRLCAWPFQRVRVTVEDSGRGMGPEEVQRLMEDRPPWITRHGVGFHVVRELVEGSGGELTISSRVGHGTRIEMCWPVAQLTEQAMEEFTARPMGVERRRTAWQS